MTDLDEWRNTIKECNDAVNQIMGLLSKERAKMSSQIISLCEKYGLLVESVDGSDDNTIFTVHLKGNTSNSIHFPIQFLLELNMDFSVQRRLDRSANNIMYLEIYPLGELDGD